MRYGDSLQKLLARYDEQLRALGGQGVAESMEAKDLTRALNELGDRDEKLKSWLPTGVDSVNASKVAGLPLVTIYSQVLEDDYASLVIPIPPNVKHVLLFGTGRTTGAVYYSDIRMRFNGDTSSTYINEQFNAANTTVSAAMSLLVNFLIAGQFSGANAAAGETGSLAAIIFNVQQSTWKWGLTIDGVKDTATTVLAQLLASAWTGSDQLSSITVYAGSGNLASGSVFSVLGIV